MGTDPKKPQEQSNPAPKGAPGQQQKQGERREAGTQPPRQPGQESDRR